MEEKTTDINSGIEDKNMVKPDNSAECKECDTSEEVDEITALKQELEKQQEEAKKNFDQYLRVLAEIDNIKKRSQRDREEYIKYANLPVIKKLLPIIDDLQRAMEVSGKSKDFDGLYKGLMMIADKMNELLNSEKVTAIECLGKPFDPQFHNPLMVEESEKFEENTVIEELQKGYIMHGRVIRPSLVKVSG